MTRLIARLVLAMLILPLSGALFVLFVGAIAARGGPPEIMDLVLMWGVLYAFIGVYWVLIWKGLVRWTLQRRLYTYLSVPLSLLIGTLTGLTFSSGAGMPPDAAMLIGGGLVPIVWVLMTVIIWRETPRERVERLTAAGAEHVSCPVCGYNLTGLREARCPECGSQFTLDQLIQSQVDRDKAVLPRD